MRRMSRAARPPRRRASAAPRAGSARRAAAAAGAGARRRTRAGWTPARRRASAGSPPEGTARSSGIGSTQAVSGSGSASAGLGGLGRSHVHRSRPPLAAAEHVEADVGGDPVEPGAQGRAALESVAARATPGRTSPGRRPRPRTRSRASGSSSRSARIGTPRGVAAARRRTRGRRSARSWGRPCYRPSVGAVMDR